MGAVGSNIKPNGNQIQNLRDPLFNANPNPKNVAVVASFPKT
jgi:hypothetical protein